MAKKKKAVKEGVLGYEIENKIMKAALQLGIINVSNLLTIGKKMFDNKDIGSKEFIVIREFLKSLNGNA
jgi:hypothetical protein